MFSEYLDLAEDQKSKVRDLLKKVKMAGVEFNHIFAEDDDGEVLFGQDQGPASEGNVRLLTYKVVY